MNRKSSITLKIALSLGLLFISIVAMLHSVEQGKIAMATVKHTYQLLNLSKNIQTTSFDHKTLISAYQQTSNADTLKQLNQARKSILDLLSKMQKLTSDNPAQQQQLKKVGDAFKAIVDESDSKQPNKGGLIMMGPTISILAEGALDPLNVTLITKLREFDSDLQKLSQAQQKSAALNSTIAEIVMLLSLVAGTGILLITLKILRREVLQRGLAEERWKFALEGAGEGVWDWDLVTDETYYSKRWGEIFGLSEDEIDRGLDDWEKRIHPEDRQSVTKNVQDYFDRKTPYYFSEYRAICKDGSYKWVRERGMIVLRHEDGSPMRMIGTLTEITERKLAQQALLESKSRLKNLIDAIPDLIWMKDVEGVYLACNTRFEKFFGKKESEIIGKTDYDFVNEELANFFRKNDEKAVDKLGPTVNEEWITFADDGHTELLETTKTPMFNAEDQVIGVLGLGHNITKRKQAEVELGIAAIAFESQEGMLVTDANNIILRVNRAFTTITGYTAEDVNGQTPSLLNSGRQNKHFYADMWESINHTGAWYGEIWNRRKNGEVYPEYLTITSVKNAAGITTNYVATMTDITSSKAASDEIKNLAFYDPLTHLPNRRLFFDRLYQGLAASGRSGHRGAILFLDLDHFKTLNDTLGHDIGDLLLQQVAERLTGSVREGDTVARLGGDEFVVLLEDLSEHEAEAAAQTEVIGDKILTALNINYQLNSHEYHSTPSIGATLFYDHEVGVEALLKQADIAMYEAKESGRNSLRFFDPKMQEVINTRVGLERELHKALDQKQFELHYQIQVSSSGEPIGAEALIRWLHPDRGMISPFNFIPLAEETGQILAVGTWVLETACAQLKKWQEDKLTNKLKLSVNVSAKQFRQAEFVEQVKAVVMHHDINPALLKLELTESILLDYIDDVISKMSELKDIGIRFELDDFGTGYSSLQYLKKLPLEQLKIDQSFVRDIVVDSSDKAIVRTIIAMAQSLDLNVIAEGVETEQQRQLLMEKGCMHYQGYLFSKPVPIEEFEQLLKKAELHGMSPKGMFLPSTLN
jgi:diguanylate cyclase (GGDEF)-like protein/PAS domain S-box-containing protein